jgi:hypothetical protein
MLQLLRHRSRDLKDQSNLQYPSESRTQFGFRIRSYAGPDHSIARPFVTQTQKSGFRMASLDRFVNKGHKKYFIHAKTV